MFKIGHQVSKRHCHTSLSSNNNHIFTDKQSTLLSWDIMTYHKLRHRFQTSTCPITHHSSSNLPASRKPKSQRRQRLSVFINKRAFAELNNHSRHYCLSLTSCNLQK